jgi:hypothetical protein
VVKPRPEVFNITKRKIHNVLQGVSSGEKYQITPEDAEMFDDWSASNAQRYWTQGSAAFSTTSVAIFDDPQGFFPSSFSPFFLVDSINPEHCSIRHNLLFLQVSGLIPILRQANPNCKSIYRSHIQIRSDLIRDESTTARRAWDFVWSRIKDAHLFISHPVESFVPDEVGIESDSEGAHCFV